MLTLKTLTCWSWDNTLTLTCWSWINTLTLRRYLIDTEQQTNEQTINNNAVKKRNHMEEQHIRPELDETKVTKKTLKQTLNKSQTIVFIFNLLWRQLKYRFCNLTISSIMASNEISFVLNSQSADELNEWKKVEERHQRPRWFSIQTIQTLSKEPVDLPLLSLLEMPLTLTNWRTSSLASDSENLAPKLPFICCWPESCDCHLDMRWDSRCLSDNSIPKIVLTSVISSNGMTLSINKYNIKC